MAIYIGDESIAEEAERVIWLLALAQFADNSKGMLKGVLKAMNLHKNAIFINLFGQVCINYTMMWYLGFYWQFKIEGVLAAAAMFQFYNLGAYLVFIDMQDYRAISDAVRQNLAVDKKGGVIDKDTAFDEKRHQSSSLSTS